MEAGVASIALATDSSIRIGSMVSSVTEMLEDSSGAVTGAPHLEQKMASSWSANPQDPQNVATDTGSGGDPVALATDSSVRIGSEGGRWGFSKLFSAALPDVEVLIRFNCTTGLAVSTRRFVGVPHPAQNASFISRDVPQMPHNISSPYSVSVVHSSNNSGSQ